MKKYLNGPYAPRDVAGLVTVALASLLWALGRPESAAALSTGVLILGVSFLLSSRRDQASPPLLARIANDAMYLSLLGIGLILLRDLLV